MTEGCFTTATNRTKQNNRIAGVIAVAGVAISTLWCNKLGGWGGGGREREIERDN